MKYLSPKDRALATIVLSVELSLLYLIGDSDDPAVVLKICRSVSKVRE